MPYEPTFQEDVIDRLARIESCAKEHSEATIKRLNDHEERVRNLESKHTRLAGALAVVTAVLGWLGYHITLH